MQLVPAGHGGGGSITVTVADEAVLPFGPVQSIPYEVVVSGFTVKAPEVGGTPPQPPEALQRVALVLDQVMVELLPCPMVGGFAAIVTVGSSGGGGGPIGGGT